jgi:precorrin-2 dehydrogenase/sirohydrochlorin ferrochelatase
MIPVALAPERLTIGLAGYGPAAARRERLLREGGAADILRFCDQSVPSLPAQVALRQLDLLWITGLHRDLATMLAAAAQRAGVLVNVEDRPELCDFHSVAELRRGDLLLTVSTGGQSPGLAGRIREWLSAQFGPEWALHLAQLGTARRRWRAEGHAPPELARRTAATIERTGWLR